jgi:branched-chain amino acid transport system permease protein
MDALLAWYAAYSNIVDTVGINALLALSLFIMLHCGQLSLGSAAYMGVGAYASALLTANLNWPFPLVLAVGMASSALCALALGLPVSRLRGVYLAIATLAFVGVMQVVALNWPLTGEAEGLTVPQETVTWHIYMALAAVCYVLWRLESSSLGRSFGAIREDEEAARAMGIDAARIKLLAFVLSGSIAGLAGALDAHLHFFISPASYGFDTAVSILTYAVVGGAASFVGSVAGATLMTVLPETLRFLHDFSTIFNGLILLLVIVLLPNGLLGLRDTIGAVWRAVRGRPSRPGLAGSAAEGQRLAPAGSADPRLDALAARQMSHAPNSTSHMLEIEHLSRVFGGVRALDDVCLRVDEGSIVGLIGPNGAGKTTLLNLLSGFDQPTTGHILLEGRPLIRARPQNMAALGVARTFQNIRLFRGLSLLDNVLAGQRLVPEPSLAAYLVGLPGARRQAVAVAAAGLDLLARFGLAERAQLPASALSYGDQRRLEIARALGRRPRLLLLDEPAAGLNPQEKEELRATVSGLAARGQTIVIVEHDMSLIMRLCQSIAVLNFGQLIAQGPPAAIVADPAVVEAYLGSDA